jgi:hypothetical protein
LFKFVRDLIYEADIGIHDLFASGTDQVGMRIGLVAIVAIATISETYFENFTDLFQQVNRFVDRGQTGGGEISLDLCVNLLNARMVLAVQKNP